MVYTLLTIILIGILAYSIPNKIRVGGADEAKGDVFHSNRSYIRLTRIMVLKNGI